MPSSVDYIVLSVEEIAHAFEDKGKLGFIFTLKLDHGSFVQRGNKENVPSFNMLF